MTAPAGGCHSSLHRIPDKQRSTTEQAQSRAGGPWERPSRGSVSPSWHTIWCTVFRSITQPGGRSRVYPSPTPPHEDTAGMPGRSSWRRRAGTMGAARRALHRAPTSGGLARVAGKRVGHRRCHEAHRAGAQMTLPRHPVSAPPMAPAAARLRAQRAGAPQPLTRGGERDPKHRASPSRAPAARRRLLQRGRPTHPHTNNRPAHILSRPRSVSHRPIRVGVGLSGATRSPA